MREVIMRVSEAAVREVQTVREGASLGEAGRLLRDADCGALPVVDADHRLVGIVTDRDIALALAAEDSPASALAVGEAMTRDVRTCRPEEDLRAALRRMTEHGVRRLPVCSAEGLLLGILSVDDLLLSEDPALDPREMIEALRRIARSYREKREARMIEEHPTI
jgi:CBS domain-containing protein